MRDFDAAGVASLLEVARGTDLEAPIAVALGTAYVAANCLGYAGASSISQRSA